jgi:hypothetical protein
MVALIHFVMIQLESGTSPSAGIAIPAVRQDDTPDIKKERCYFAHHIFLVFPCHVVLNSR